MKKTSIISIVVVVMMMISGQVGATGDLSSYDKYEISLVDNLYLGKKMEKVWSIRYNVEKPAVTVVKHTTLEGVEYSVHSQYFEVSYLSNGDGFGAKRIRKSWANVPATINNAVINSQEMERQRIISPGKVSDDEALALIAGYLPVLLNGNYTHLLN
jgi:hypothetical protein